MKLFKGSRNTDQNSVTVEDNGVARPLDPRFDLRNHSPDGFEWGYGGSGPAQLALAILSEMYSDETAQTYYQYFKEEMIAGLGQQSFTITEDMVDEWLGSFQRKWTEMR